MSDQLIQRLEEQLRDAHAANAELRTRVAEAARIEHRARAQIAEATLATRQLERAHAKQKAAEDNAAAAQHARPDAERDLVRARGEIEELSAQLATVRADAEAYAELNARVERARHSADLFA